MVLLSHLKNNSKTASIFVFWLRPSNPEWQSLHQDFDYINYGILNRVDVAELLKQSTIFIDLSDYQLLVEQALKRWPVAAFQYYQ